MACKVRDVLLDFVSVLHRIQLCKMFGLSRYRPISAITDYRVNDRSSIPGWCKEYLSSTKHWDWVCGRSSSYPSEARAKEAKGWNWSFQSNVEVKGTWSYTSTSPCAFMAWYLINHRGNYDFWVLSHVLQSLFPPVVSLAKARAPLLRGGPWPCYWFS